MVMKSEISVLSRNKTSKSPRPNKACRWNPKAKTMLIWFHEIKYITYGTFIPAEQATKHSTFKCWNVYDSIFVTHVRKWMHTAATMAWLLINNYNLHCKCKKIKTVCRDKVPHTVLCDICYSLLLLTVEHSLQYQDRNNTPSNNWC